MVKFNYRVFIPEFIVEKINLKSREFEDENFLIARNSALEYLSFIVSELCRLKIITISDFMSENSPELIEVEKLPKNVEDDKILDFKYLSECKIKYNYTQADFGKTEKIRSEKKMDLYNAFLELGILTLEIADEKKQFIGVFELVNYDKHLNLFIHKKERLILYKMIPTFSDASLHKLHSNFQFNLKEKHHQFREIFLTENNLREKEIITNDLFFDFERKLLSIYNRRCMVSFFIEEKYCVLARKTMLHLQSVYGNLKREYTPKVVIQNNLYSVYFFDFNTELKLTYSQTGSLYFRGYSGVMKANENTSFEELICNENCKDEFMKDFLKKL